MQDLPRSRLVAVDTETTGLRPWSGDRPFAVSMCGADGQTFYIQWEVDPQTRIPIIPNQDRLILGGWFADEKVTKVFHNSQFDLRMLELGLNMRVEGQIEDTLIGAHVLWTNRPTYALKPLGKALLDMDDEDEKNLAQQVIKSRRSAKIKGWQVAESTECDYWIPKQLDASNDLCEVYAVNDARRTMNLWQLIEPKLNRTGRYGTYRWEMDVLRPVLSRMETWGMRVHPSVIKEEIETCRTIQQVAQWHLNRIAGETVNPGSHPQVKKLLFEKLNLEVKDWTKTGQPSTSTEALAHLSDSPAVRQIIRYRAAAKAVTSFFEKYEHYMTKDGTIHPQIRQIGTATARLSCYGINLQAITGTEGGKSKKAISAKKPLGPRNGFRWFLFDYNQLEVRTFAAASQYSKLIDFLDRNEDMHTYYTNIVWGGRENFRTLHAAMEALNTKDEDRAHDWLEEFDYDIVRAEASLGKKTSRNKGKPFFFTRMFGGGPRAISAALKCTYEEAQEYIHAYDRAFPGIIKFVQQKEEEGRKNGYVTTLYGRELDLMSGDEIKASPYIVAGTAADLVKHSMVQCDQFLRREKIPGGMVMQIHDELIFELPRRVEDEVIQQLKTLMEDEKQTIGLEVPCKVKVADRYWSETRNYELPRTLAAMA